MSPPSATHDSNARSDSMPDSMPDTMLRVPHHRLGDVSALLGYQWQGYDWRSYGGDANYAGPLPPGAGISSAQRWYTPTLGLHWSCDFGAVDVRLQGSGSASASATDRDPVRPAP